MKMQTQWYDIIHYEYLPTYIFARKINVTKRVILADAILYLDNYIHIFETISGADYDNRRLCIIRSSQGEFYFIFASIFLPIKSARRL